MLFRRSLSVFLTASLCLPMLGLGEEVKGKAEAEAETKPTSDLFEYPTAFAKCTEVFNKPHLDAYVVKAIMNAIMKVLQPICPAQEKLALMPSIIAGNLYCNHDYANTIEHLLSFLEGDSAFSCRRIKGFSSHYVK